MNEQKEEIMAGKPEKDEFLVAGIGASAGGLEALQEFFKHVPENSGIAYVVILHLSPDHDSQLATILGRVAVIPVTQVIERVRIEPDHVYVISPNHHLTMEDNEIVVTPNLFTEDRRAPVDIFFRTLGDTYHSRAVGVILSGTGANGSMGIKRIKERGGAAFVQNPREAQFNEMPRNAIASELVDSILNVAEIPAKIIQYKESLGLVQIAEESTHRPEDQQHALREIFTQLRIRTGHDFSNYKRATLLRRIERRVNVHNLPSLTAYAAFMQQNLDEPVALLKDLLISVTNFFRDKKAFEAIENDILPRILKNKGDGSALRIWVIGCATGEEVYSLAMLCAERILHQLDAPKVQIFATDIDEAAIATAREGVYTLNDAADVSPERLRRFFTKEGDSYRIRREIREMVLFANHNVLKDPPFSHLDMVTCRNMMIYLNSTAQERVLETIHFALEPGGYLFLGSSESTEGAGDLFLVANREYHIYQSRAVSPRNYPVPESIPNYRTTNPIDPDIPHDGNSHPLMRLNYADLHQQLLEQYAPPSIVVNEEYDIVHLTERAGRYLQITGGEISKNILKLIRPEIRLELRTAFYQAVQRRANVEARDLKVKIDDSTESINIHVRPVLREDDTTKGFMLVLFEPVTGEYKEEEQRIYTTDEPIARQLEEELVRMKARLRSTIEQHELQAEELKASNEELQALNEELRSAAEELETSKEELQSVNEELTTVNQELKVKIEETTNSNNNFQNLINSTHIATLFLDRSLRINMFTPAAREIFNVIHADTGRPVSDITNKLEYSGLLDDAETVLDKLMIVEREVRTYDGKNYLMRALPYRTEEDRINGVVVTFINITELKKAEEALRATDERMRLIVENAKDYAIFTLDMHRCVNSWNIGAQNVFGFAEEEIIGKSGDIVFVPEDREEGMPAKEAETAQQEGHAENERWHLRKDGTRFYGSGITMPMHNDAGEMIGQVKILRDLTEQKQAEEALRANENRQAFLVKLGDVLRPLSNPIHIQEAASRVIGEQLGVGRAFYCEMEADGDHMWIRRNYLNGVDTQEGYFSISDFGPFLLEEYNAGRTVVINDASVDNRLSEAERAAYLTINVRAFMCVPLVKEGRLVSVLAVNHPTPRNWTSDEVALLEETTQRTQAALERANAEEALRQSEERLQKAISITTVGVIFFDLEGKINNANEAFQQMSGYSKEDFINGKVRWNELTPPEFMEVSLKAVQELITEGQSTPYEKQYIRPDGSRWWGMFTGKRLNENEIVEFVIDITERKLFEEALLRSEESLRTITDNLPALIAYHDIEQRYLFVNAEFERFFDLPKEQIVGKTMKEFLKPHVYERLRNCVEKALAGDRVSFEDVEPDKFGPGQHSWTEENYIPRLGPDGKVEGFFVLAHIITERKRTEDALRASESRFRTVTDAVPQVIWTNDARGKANYFNQRWYEYCGLSYEQSEGLGWQAIVHHDDEAASVERWQRALAAGEEFETEYRLRRADGTYRWHLGRNVPLKGEKGEILGWFGSATDIEDLALAQASLRESEERTRAIVSQTSVGILRTDVNGHFVFMNDKARSMFGLNGTNGTESSIWDLTTIEDMDEHRRLFKRLIDEGLPYQFERKLKRLNGSHFWASVSIAPIKNEKGKTLSAVSVIVDVTGRKQAEEALRETMERFQFAIQATKDVIWEIDFKRNHVWWSSMMHTLFGYTQRDVQHSIAWFQSLIHPDDQKQVANSFNAAIEGKETLWTDEFRYRQASGEYMYINCRSFIIRDGEGKALRMIGAMQDITERRLAEEAVRKSEERLRVTMQSATDYVIITQDVNGNIENWNSGAERIFGYKAEETIGKYCDFFYTPEDRAAGIPEKEMETAKEEGRASDERWHLRKDGTRVFMSGVLAPIRNNGILTGFVKVARDMTSQKEAENALQAAQSSLRTALEAAQMGVWDLDLATDTVMRSPRHDQLLGYPTFQEEWSFEKAVQHMAKEDKAKFMAARESMLETGIFDMEARIQHTNGSVCWVQVYGRLFRNEKGEPTHAAGVIFDITDRKTVEQKKDEFIGIASHELKTPVTSIKAYTEILHEQFEEAGDVQSALYLSKLNHQVDRLTGLIRDLLDVTRISEGRLTIKEYNFDPNQMLRDTTDELQRTTGKHKIELNLQELPAFKGDKERLQQVFVNLLSNAVKYSPEANRIIVRSYRDNGNINIEVQDFGIGMSPDTKNRLFERFFRSSDPQITTFPGLGLGLYISMEIVKQHKGTIRVQSEKGKGSVFTVVLPVRE